MANENQPNRTQLTDLPAAEQEMTAEEMANVQGGASNLNLSKSNINVAPPPGAAIPTSEKNGPNAVNVKLA